MRWRLDSNVGLDTEYLGRPNNQDCREGGRERRIGCLDVGPV